MIEIDRAFIHREKLRAEEIPLPDARLDHEETVAEDAKPYRHRPETRITEFGQDIGMGVVDDSGESPGFECELGPVETIRLRDQPFDGALEGAALLLGEAAIDLRKAA